MDQVIAGRYALGALLGSGGMAKVYAAHDQRLGRTVAIKLVPLAGAEPIARQRFVREARSAAGFSHPNAVEIFDAGDADGYLYLVMELVSGQSLAERLADNGPLDPVAAANVAIAVLSALGAAHAVGIVHRDVKPANILLAAGGGVKLADFGIAKRLDDVAGDVTMVGEFVGTPKYIAPEQVSGHPASAASDVYALGVVLYEMLSGRAPFDAETPVATALAHLEAPVPDISVERPAVPLGLALAIRTAMAKDPSARYDSAGAMLAAIAATPSPVGPFRPPRPRAPQPTQVMAAGGYTRSSFSRSWVALAAALLIGAAVLAVIVVRGDDPEGADLSPTLPPTAAASPSVSTSSVATTTLPPTTTLVAAAADSIEGVIAALQANPGAFGPRAEDVIEQLGTINGNGRSAQRRAGELLADAAGWVESGELTPAVLTMLEPILGPIAGSDDGEGDDDDD